MTATEKEKTIVVIGPPGTGKTKLINLACKTALPEGGVSVEECTINVHITTFVLDDQPVRLIDTPGFEGDASIRKIKAFLRKSENKRLTGIIYMHRITDNRMSGGAVKSFAAFCGICGDDAMNNVSIVTTMWDLTHEGVGAEKEMELRTKDYGYKATVEKGAKLLRHNGTAESATAILRQMLDNDPVTLQFQTSSNGQEDPHSTSMWYRFKETCRRSFWRLYKWCMVPLRPLMMLQGIQRGERLTLDS